MANDSLWFLNSHVSVLLAQNDNADCLSILRHIAAFDDAPPWHVHHDEEEVFQILEGRLRFKRGDEVIEAGAGETIVLLRGVPHGFRVISADGARFLTITRGPFEAMVRAAGRPADHEGLPEPRHVTPEIAAQFADLCAAHRIDLIGPPID